MKKAAIFFVLPAFLAGCGWLNSSPDPKPIAEGYIEVPQPDKPNHFQKVHLRCARVYNPGSQEFNLTGVKVPITAVIKPEIGGISTRETADAVTEKITGLDLQQMQVCTALLISQDAQSRDQILRDYIGIGGQLTSLIRSLSDATTASQYVATAKTSQPATVAPATADAANKAKQTNSDLASLNIPPLNIQVGAMRQRN